MVQIVLFHHVQGLTPGVQTLADELDSAGHTVHTVDLFDGKLAADIPTGLQLVQDLGELELQAKAERFVAQLPAELVYAGISWGSALAQKFAQQRRGARGVILLEAFVALDAPWSFGPWPQGLHAQIHGMDADPFFSGEGDLAAARQLEAQQGKELIELYTYRGSAHLFTDSSLCADEPRARALVVERIGDFLCRLES